MEINHRSYTVHSLNHQQRLSNPKKVIEWKKHKMQTGSDVSYTKVCGLVHPTIKRSAIVSALDNRGQMVCVSHVLELRTLRIEPIDKTW